MDDRPGSARSNTPRFDTAAVHAGDAPDPSTGALDPPVVLSSAYAFEDAADAAGQFDGTRPGHIYSRWRNPTVRALELKIAALEQAEDCVALASGMAAVHAALIANLNAGEHVVAAESLYAETGRLLRGTLARFGVETTFVDATDPAKIEAALRPDTRVVYLETPANPTLAITDVAEVARRCPRATVIVDSTFATPYHQRLLGRGAHLVVHSATKGLCGHGDAVGGAVVGDAARILRVREEGVRTAGGALSPMNAMLLSRGARTLGVRMQRASESAAELARRLREDARVARVHYPGLADHPGHAVAKAQMRNGFGALLAFEVAGGREAGARCYDAVRVISRAVSLGDVRSLMTHAASTTHASWTDAQRAQAGIADGLMRLSVGIEDVEDLWADLDAALG
ncbi:MAG: aminotransferase class I/II-fold pyridoxal phosphate-dependent enzyme [Sandaracinaceae bacterium]|nr:MAG: aminotransferase class I/II-fold pyridoxal phosphate-dependent enzyme [Sandaracinaceae bacterium]